MLWSIDSWPVSANQYNLIVSGAQVSTHRRQVFLKLTADKLLVLKGSQAQAYFFKNSYEYAVLMCRTIKILILNWPRTRKFSHTVSFDFTHHGHALITL